MFITSRVTSQFCSIAFMLQTFWYIKEYTQIGYLTYDKIVRFARLLDKLSLFKGAFTSVQLVLIAHTWYALSGLLADIHIYSSARKDLATSVSMHLQICVKWSQQTILASFSSVQLAKIKVMTTFTLIHTIPHTWYVEECSDIRNSQ